MKNKSDFAEGMRDAFPVFILYFCVSVSLGITCSNAGLNWFESALMSLLNLTSAGEFAAVGIMSKGGSYAELALSQFIINIRYLLMSAALIIKLSPDEPMGKRLLMGFGITDEIFGLSVRRKNPLSASYTIGCLCTACPGWVIGTVLGVVMGNILPDMIVSALSTSFYSMLICIVLAPARYDFTLMSVVLVSMGFSWLFGYFVSEIPSGIRCFVLTVIISALIAWFFPHSEDEYV